MIKTILIVEDDDGIGVFLAQAISLETPYQAMVVTTGQQALRVVQGIKPDLFILDYQLPGPMNGLELYDQLHEIKELQHVPALMISAHLPKQEIAKRDIVGMSKPLDLQTLLDAIGSLLS